MQVMHSHKYYITTGLRLINATDISHTNLLVSDSELLEVGNEFHQRSLSLLQEKPHKDGQEVLVACNLVPKTIQQFYYKILNHFYLSQN